MRKDFGPQSLIYPEPVLIIATYNDDDSVNAMNAAWGGVSDTNEICICLAKHKTTDNILKRKYFTVSMGTKQYVKECDYLGLVSGNNVKDKVKKVKFHTVKSKKIDAPIIKELPLTLECELIKYEKGSGHLFAKVLNVSVDESIITDGKVDLKKYSPIIFDGLNNEYYCLGKKVGKAFSIGNKIK